MGICVSIPYLKCSDFIPSPAGEQHNLSARMYLITTEHDILMLYTDRCFCFSLIYSWDAVIISLVTVGDANSN